MQQRKKKRREREREREVNWNEEGCAALAVETKARQPASQSGAARLLGKKKKKGKQERASERASERTNERTNEGLKSLGCQATFLFAWVFLLFQEMARAQIQHLM